MFFYPSSLTAFVFNGRFDLDRPWARGENTRRRRRSGPSGVNGFARITNDSTTLRVRERRWWLTSSAALRTRQNITRTTARRVYLDRADLSVDVCEIKWRDILIRAVRRRRRTQFPKSRIRIRSARVRIKHAIYVLVEIKQYDTNLAAARGDNITLSSSVCILLYDSGEYALWQI